MRLLIDVDGSPREIELNRSAPSATLADLVAEACGYPIEDETTLYVDDQAATAGTPLAELLLLEGSTVARSPLRRPGTVDGWTATLSGGLDAGRVVPIPANRPLIIGRSPQADIAVNSASTSWEHATLTLEGDGVRVRDAGSTNGTLVDGRRVPRPDDEDHTDDDEDSDDDGKRSRAVELIKKARREEPAAPRPDGILVTDQAVVVAGGVTVLIRKRLPETPAPAPGSLHNLTPAGTAPFNRPPRPGRPQDPEPIQPPARKDVPDATKFGLAMIVAPLVLAGAMVLILGDPRFALMAALSPILGVGTWIEGKHRRAKNLKAEEKRFAEAVDTFRDELAEAAAEGSRRSYADTPDPATVIRRAAIPTMTLWERRVQAADFLHLHAGIGDIPWSPPIDERSGTRLDDKVKEAVRESRLPSAAVEVDLSDAGVVGIVGERDGALAVARSLLVQAATQSGPADLTVGVFCDQGRDEEWAWSSWLPHLRRHGGGAGERWLSDNRSRSDELLRSLRDEIDEHPTPAVLLVLDSDVLTEGRNAPARTLLGHGRTGPTSSSPRRPPTQVSGIVVATSEDQLPAACTVVINVGADAAGTVTRPGDLKHVDDVVLAGISLATARRTAMDLARFDDPDLVVPGAALPSLVRLPPLLGFEQITAEEIRKSWSDRTGVSTPVGIGEGGPFSLDLVRDGPHGLVGGTTGSGKSEFLRSLVAGLAARNDPTRLTFILIDFKGGAAFKTCERLPHTIGTISNLDEQLANRALRALEAEMQYRQRMFAAAGEGVDNLDAYLATNPSEPMPRLLLVVDEFAMLAREYPDVLSSLVSVAAVGRTLGVHMILATQRPAGVVNDDILANTNLRVALRVQSREDSSNVIGVVDAAAISRRQQGRAYVKLGQDDITPVQTALVTGQSEQQAVRKVEALPVVFGRVQPASTGAQPSLSEDPPADLDLLIDAIVAAADDAGIAPPRPVWPEPLGERVELTGFPHGEADPDAPPPAEAGGVDEAGRVTFAVSDDPDRQRQIPAGWDLERGNLLLMGIPGSGTSTTLSTVALTLAQAIPPDRLDLVVLDMGSGDLRPLADLPHTAGYVGSGSGAREQQVRLLRYLRSELDRRKAGGTGHRRTVVLIDGLAALREEYQDFEGIALMESMYRAYTDGPELGLHFAVATTRAKSVPPAIDEVTTQKWLFRLADQYDYSAAGIKPHEAPSPVPGRCVLGETRLQTHVATPGCGLEQAVAQVVGRWNAPRKADVVGRLPDRVTVPDLGARPVLDGEPWLIPVGIREVDLEPQQLELYEGEHLMIAGPVRSGKSTLLLALAELLRSAGHPAGPVQVWGVGDRRSPLLTSPLFDRTASGQDDLAPLLAEARMHDGPLVIMIDDADRFDDADQSITGLLGAGLPNLRVFAAGRSDDLRSMYSHWSKAVRKSRCGVLLQPNVDYDGELLGVTVPRRAPVALTVGRGYACVAGELALVQTVSPAALA